MAKRKVHKHSHFIMILIGTLSLVFLLEVGYSTLGAQLGIAGNVQVKKYVEPTLYNVLRNEALSNGLAREYTDPHNDSYDPSLSTEKVYHWYAQDSTEGASVLNKNNVIFADHCWQMIRTTDTGGVKLLYNGVPENNQCLNTRGTHEGYGSYTSYNFNGGNYWYGTDYYYDRENNTFQLTGTTEQALWSDSTASDLIGKFTCRLTDQNGTCSTLYYIVSYLSNRAAYCLTLVPNANYSNFGSLYYNSSYQSPAYGGYMYNKVYTTSYDRNYNEEYVISTTTGLSDTVSYWFSDSYSWSYGGYTLVNPYQISAVSDYSELIGKYTFAYENYDPNSSYDTIFYIADVIFDDYNNHYSAFLVRLTDNNTDPIYDVYTYGDSFRDNGDGTYTILNPSQMMRSEWYSKRTEYVDVYVCKNATNDTCEDLWYVYSYVDNNGETFYWNISSGYYYSGSFSYENGQYHLGDDAVYIWLTNQEAGNVWDTHHYYCKNHSTTCTELNYIADLVNGNQPGYITLTGGESEVDAVHNMFYADDVNTINSTIKTGVDAWYEMNLLDYSSYIEDSIYCNNRTISEYWGWQNNGEMHWPATSKYLHFSGDGIYYNINTNIYCNNVTDQFSVSNPKARLKYPIGLLTTFEAHLSNNYSSRVSPETYWLMSPNSYTTAWGMFQNYVTNSGSVSSGNIQGKRYGVRPVISLKAGMEYSSGTGAMDDPYIVKLGD